jgi:hypothetical protein
MEAIISVICALGGLVSGLLFLWEMTCIAVSGGAARRKWLRVVVLLLITLLLLHFHFELDILD